MLCSVVFAFLIDGWGANPFTGLLRQERRVRVFGDREEEALFETALVVVTQLLLLVLVQEAAFVAHFLGACTLVVVLAVAPFTGVHHVTHVVHLPRVGHLGVLLWLQVRALEHAHHAATLFVVHEELVVLIRVLRHHPRRFQLVSCLPRSFFGLRFVAFFIAGRVPHRGFRLDLVYLRQCFVVLAHRCLLLGHLARVTFVLGLRHLALLFEHLGLREDVL